jgi:NAD(P)-dependent dehydrogenase (short-subunit alcohol dehydrogenase family)
VIAEARRTVQPVRVDTRPEPDEPDAERVRGGDVAAVRTPAALFDLTGRVVILTGASSGLGARWAPVLAAAGAQVVLTARREPELLSTAARTPAATVMVGDITDPTHRGRLVDATLETFGRIDVLVNNAGGAASAPALDTTTEDFRSMIDTDLVALFALSRLVGRHMVEAGHGSIINNASLAAERSVDRYPLSAYSAAKAGVVAVTRSLAAEWGRFGVRVNAVGPAFFPTPTSGNLEDPEQVGWIEQHNALGRTARIDELDGTILFLASDASSFVTGQHLLVDGGWSVF